MTSEEKDREIIRLIDEVRQLKASSGYVKAAVQRKEIARLLAVNTALTDEVRRHLEIDP